jgi:hypothetical protein
MRGIDGCDTGNGGQIQVFRADAPPSPKMKAGKYPFYTTFQPQAAWIGQCDALDRFLYDHFII